MSDEKIKHLMLKIGYDIQIEKYYIKFGFEYCSLDPTVKVGSGYCSNCKYCIECSTDGSWIKCKKLVS